MDLGPHAAFIWAAHAAEALVLAALIGWLFFDGARQKQQLADLERRGVTRRGSGPAKGTP
jgi:heme exporter protein D